jgi:hypothetical protein
MNQSVLTVPQRMVMFPWEPLGVGSGSNSKHVWSLVCVATFCRGDPPEEGSGARLPCPLHGEGHEDESSEAARRRIEAGKAVSFFARAVQILEVRLVPKSLASFNVVALKVLACQRGCTL